MKIPGHRGLETLMERWTTNQILWAEMFLVITYLSLQCVAVWKCRGAGRVAAALPLLVMIPTMIGVFLQWGFDLGISSGTLFLCPYLPAMIYLLAVSFAGPRSPVVCPHCGHKPKAKSFRIASSTANCEKCGKDCVENAATMPDSALNRGK